MATNHTPPAPQRTYSADLGMHVTIEMLSIEGIERMEFDIVPDQYADIRLGFLGIGTPLAKSILGHKPGEIVASLADDTEKIRLLAVVPSTQPPPKEIADRRQQTIRSAVDDSDHTNAVIFASSFSGKWGDYDPNSIASDHETEEPKKE